MSAFDNVTALFGLIFSVKVSRYILCSKYHIYLDQFGFFLLFTEQFSRWPQKWLICFERPWKFLASNVGRRQNTIFYSNKLNVFHAEVSKDDFRSGCRNVSHQQQFFSELHSPGRSHYTNYIYSIKGTIRTVCLPPMSTINLICIHSSNGGRFSNKGPPCQCILF